MTNLEIFPNGIKIIQNKEYCFTKDSIDLAKFCNSKSGDNVLELCAGCGVISFYAFALNKFSKLYLNELQTAFCQTIDKNIKLNNMQDKAFLLPGDLNELKAQNFEKKFDVIICNPPYFKNGSVAKTPYNICKYEISVTLKDVISKARELIKDKGKLYLSMTADRSAELLGELYASNFHAKRIKYLSNDKSEAYLMLVEAVFNGKIGSKIIVK